MSGNAFTTLCFSDLAGQLRGHGVPHRRINEVCERGLPWPRELATLTAFGTPVPTAWQGSGELRLMPDAGTELIVEPGEGGQSQRFMMSTLETGDGEAWHGCTRSFLQDALDAIKTEYNLDVACGYQHAFMLDRRDATAGPAMSLAALRREAQFADILSAQLDAAGIDLLRFGAGLAANQFVAVTGPRFGLAGADSAVMFREIARATAEHLNARCSFSPFVAAAAPYNGVTLRIDLFDDGDQVAYDPGAPGGVSAIFGSFLAGITRHLPALCAFTQPSLVPAANGNSAPNGHGGHDQPAATIRINPELDAVKTRGREYALAFQAADATACPYLQLGVILRAGLAGMQNKLPYRNGDADGAARQSSPQTLAARLDALDNDHDFTAALPPDLLAGYTRVRRAELATVSDWSADQIYAWAREVY